MTGFETPTTTTDSHGVMTKTQELTTHPKLKACLAIGDLGHKQLISIPFSDPVRLNEAPIILKRKRSQKRTLLGVRSLWPIINRQPLIRIGLICLALLSVNNTIAQGDMTEDSMRCGTSLVNIGDTQQDVLKMCGKPYALRDLVDPNAPQQIVGDQPVDNRPNIQWIYHPGYGQFDNVLVFEGGQVTQIKVQNSGD